MRDRDKVVRRLSIIVALLATLSACSSTHADAPMRAATTASPSGDPLSSPATRSSSTASSSGSVAGPAGPCPAAALGISRGPRLSPATGEDGLILTVTSAVGPCTVVGFPTVTLLDSTGSRVRFSYVLGKGQYVTHRRPQPVTVGGGKLAFFLVAKYRCDTGYSTHVSYMNVTLPGQGTTLSVPSSWLVGTFAYCTGGPVPDPGNNVAISPFEPSVAVLAD